MLSNAVMLAILAAMGFCGFQLTRVLKLPDMTLRIALGLPLGLCFALLFLGILAPLGIPLPWILILSMAATFSGFAFRSAAPIG
ncbi:MAG: hypothetical protein K6G50_02595, partial [bacterium]|nr:hypothetical protein [bacterium]